jgi:hypothetical protein
MLTFIIMFLGLILGIALGWYLNNESSGIRSLMIGFGIILLFSISNAMTFFMTSFATSFSLSFFLLFCAFIAFSCASLQQNYLGVWVSIFFVLRGWEV